TDHRAAGALGTYAGGYPRVRTRVDEDAPLDEDPVGLLEGIDHALVRNSSERPGEDHDVERRVRQSQGLRGSLGELHVREALALGLGPPASERATIRVDRDHRDRIPSRAEREPA